VGDLTGPTSASVIIVTYNSALHLGRLFAALAADDQGPAEVIVVDNASSDDGADLAERAGARVVRLEQNEGFAIGCHVGVEVANQGVVVFLNPDTVPSPGWLLPLLAALDLPGVGAASPTIDLTAQAGRFNTSGGGMTFYGLAWASDLGTPIDDATEPATVPFPSGAAVAMRRSTWAQLGGFRRDFFMYYEDADLGWRMRMRGLRSVRVPTSVVAHDYDFGRNPDKLYRLERNRLLALRANYRRGTRVLLGPALWIANRGITFVALRDGWWRRRVAAAWSARRSSPETNSHYARNQQERTVGDAAVIEALASGLDGMTQQSAPRGAEGLAMFFRLWQRLVLPLVRRADRGRDLA
jgi:GT2 family glycosyltransferase